NSLHKVDALLRALTEFRAGLAEEARLYREREPEVEALNRTAPRSTGRKPPSGSVDPKAPRPGAHGAAVSRRCRPLRRSTAVPRVRSELEACRRRCADRVEHSPQTPAGARQPAPPVHAGEPVPPASGCSAAVSAARRRY